MDVYGLSEKTMDYNIKCYFTHVWKDQRLKVQTTIPKIWALDLSTPVNAYHEFLPNHHIGELLVEFGMDGRCRFPFCSTLNQNTKHQGHLTQQTKVAIFFTEKVKSQWHLNHASCFVKDGGGSLRTLLKISRESGSRMCQEKKNGWNKNCLFFFAFCSFGWHRIVIGHTFLCQLLWWEKYGFQRFI